MSIYHVQENDIGDTEIDFVIKKHMHDFHIKEVKILALIRFRHNIRPNNESKVLESDSKVFKVDTTVDITETIRYIRLTKHTYHKFKFRHIKHKQRIYILAWKLT